MMKIFVFVFALSFSIALSAQENKLYHPFENADSAITAALKKAKAENKYVLIQGGGNWYRICQVLYRR